MPRDLKTRWFHILLALAAGPRHGLAVMRDVRQSSNGAIHLWPATLYGSLEELMDLGWIQEVNDADLRPEASERRRYYGLTRSGRVALDTETQRLADLVRIARAASRRQNA